MTKRGIAFAIAIGVLLPSSAWAVSQGASCRPGVRPQSHAAGITLLCWASQDPWQDCGEDPWQLSAEVASRDSFSDPWQVGDGSQDASQDASQDGREDGREDPWQPFPRESVANRPTRLQPAAIQDPWQTMHVRVVKPSSAIPVCDALEDPWQPASADPWQDDLDPWQ
jgi:hypothetical protein